MDKNIKDKNSVLLKVDESTRGIMEDLKEGIGDAVSSKMQNVTDKVTEQTNEILEKFKNFDGLKMSMETIESLRQESRRMASKLTPLAEIEQGINKHTTSLDTLNSVMTETHKSMRALEVKIDEMKIESDTTIKNINALEEQIRVLKDLAERQQKTLDIVVNLVTPFWKRWGHKDNEDDNQ